MHDDVKVAFALVHGSPRASKTLKERYRDELELALEHCRVAVELGLEFDEYGDGVLIDAAKSLLHSYPASRSDASLDPHVDRILGHRDFALSLLLRRQVENAWRVFVQRFGTFIRSLFIRDGLSYDEAQQELEGLIVVLADDAEGVPPIAGYHGSVDLNNWLYCFVRSRRQKVGPIGRVTIPLEHNDPGFVLPLVLNEGELREHFRNEFSLLWQKIAAPEREFLSAFAHGHVPLYLVDENSTDEKAKALGPQLLFEKHSNLIKSLAVELRKSVVGHYRGLVSAAVIEEAIIDIVTAGLVDSLTPIVGSMEPVKRGDS